MLRRNSSIYRNEKSPDLSLGLAANISKRVAFAPPAGAAKSHPSGNANASSTMRRSSSKIMQIPEVLFREASSVQLFKLAAIPDTETTTLHSIESSVNTFTEVDFKLPELDVQLGQNIQDVLLHEQHKDLFKKVRKEIANEMSLLRRLDNLAKTPDHMLMGKNPRFDGTGNVVVDSPSKSRPSTGLPLLDATSPHKQQRSPPGSRMRSSGAHAHTYAFEGNRGSPAQTQQLQQQPQRAVTAQSGRRTLGFASLHAVPMSIRRSSSDAALNPAQVRARRNSLECKSELALIKHVICRGAGELRDKLTAMEHQLEMESKYGIDDDYRESTLDHPKLGSIEEKMEDLRHEEIERWCAKHGLRTNEKYTNMEKRKLRRWFQAMDNDGSGEVNVEELQDPMLSAGILKTREQVVRVLANVDKNGTMGIDFEEFLLALSANKLADKSKLRKLQEMSMDPIFDVDTLITAERRKKLIKSILQRSQHRQEEMDKLYKKYDKAKLTKKEREQLMHEQEVLEDKQQRSIFLHLKYLNALDRVLVDKKNQHIEITLERERELEQQLEAQEQQKEIVQKQLAREGSQLFNDLEKKAADMVDSNGLPIVPLDVLAEVMGVKGTEAERKKKAEEAERLKEIYHNPYSVYAPPRKTNLF